MFACFHAINHFDDSTETVCNPLQYRLTMAITILDFQRNNTVPGKMMPISLIDLGQDLNSDIVVYNAMQKVKTKTKKKTPNNTIVVAMASKKKKENTKKKENIAPPSELLSEQSSAQSPTGHQSSAVPDEKISNSQLEFQDDSFMQSYLSPISLYRSELHSPPLDRNIYETICEASDPGSSLSNIAEQPSQNISSFKYQSASKGGRRDTPSLSASQKKSSLLASRSSSLASQKASSTGKGLQSRQASSTGKGLQSRPVYHKPVGSSLLASRSSSLSSQKASSTGKGLQSRHTSVESSLLASRSSPSSNVLLGLSPGSTIDVSESSQPMRDNDIYLRLNDVVKLCDSLRKRVLTLENQNLLQSKSRKVGPNVCKTVLPAVKKYVENHQNGGLADGKADPTTNDEFVDLVIANWSHEQKKPIDSYDRQDVVDILEPKQKEIKRTIQRQRSIQLNDIKAKVFDFLNLLNVALTSCTDRIEEDPLYILQEIINDSGLPKLLVIDEDKRNLKVLYKYLWFFGNTMRKCVLEAFIKICQDLSMAVTVFNFTKIMAVAEETIFAIWSHSKNSNIDHLAAYKRCELLCNEIYFVDMDVEAVRNK